MSHPYSGPMHTPGPGQSPSAYGAPAYGAPTYSAPGYQPAYPGYGAFGPAGDVRPPRSNPAAAILLILGSLLALLHALIPPQGSKPPLVASLQAIDSVSEVGAREALIMLAPIPLTVGALMALVAGMTMFAARRHGGAASTGLIASLLMLAFPAAMLIGFGAQLGTFFHSLRVFGWMAMLAWVPTLAGSLAGFRK